MPEDNESADSATESTESTASTTTPPVEAKTADKDWQAEAEKWRRLSRENESRAKANATAAERLAALEESQKSEAQKVSEKATEAERRAEAAERALIRYRVAATKGLPPELVERLQGNTEEEMAADADALLKLIKPKPEMRADPSQGARGSNTAPDMNALLRTAAGRG